MLTQTIRLWEDRDDARMEGYVLRQIPKRLAGNRRPAVLICPGGSFLRPHENDAEPVAMRFAGQGYHAFVVRYTTYYREWKSEWVLDPPPGNPRAAYPQPLVDVAKAVHLVRSHADEWLVDPDRIIVAGFSAGAHLAASLGVHWHEPFLREKVGANGERFKPNALLLGYPVLDFLLMRDELAREENERNRAYFRLIYRSLFGTEEPDDGQLAEASPALHVTAHTPPAFIWHMADDGLVYAKNSLHFALAMASHHVPYELHIFSGGGHGMALCDETTATRPEHVNPEAAVWFDLALNWLRKRFA